MSHKVSDVTSDREVRDVRQGKNMMSHRLSTLSDRVRT